MDSVGARDSQARLFGMRLRAATCVRAGFERLDCYSLSQTLQEPTSKMPSGPVQTSALQTPRCLIFASLCLETNRGGPLAHTFSKGFSVSKMGPSNRTKAECRNKVQEKTLFSKKKPEDASRHPKPTLYPQTRQDPVVGVFPMESSTDICFLSHA